MDPIPPVDLERVRARIVLGSIVASVTPDAGELHDPDPALAGEGRHAISPRAVAEALAHGAVPAGALLTLFLATRDAPLALVGGGALFTARALRAMAAGVRFGFGDGFLGFRSEAGWPRGVQEDDDFRWSWSAGRDTEEQPANRWPPMRPVDRARRPPASSTH